MSSQYFVCIFLWVYVLQFICCVESEQSSKTPTSGPFKTSIIGIKDCSNPFKPYVKDPPVVFLPTIHNGTMSGNITYFKATKNMKIKVKGFIQRNGKWEPAYLINNLDCHGMVIHLMCATMNIKYDRKQCVYFKGPFKTSIVSVNDCVSTRIPYLKDPPIMYYPSVLNIDGKNVLAGNLTVYKDAKDVKGSYVFQKMDVNQLQHIWVPSMPYGRLLWRTETFSKDGTFFCKEFDTVTEPGSFG